MLSPSLRAFAVVLLLALPAAAQAAPIFSSTSLSETAISPNSDGVQDFTVVTFVVAVPEADVRVQLLPVAGGTPQVLLPNTRRAAGTHTVLFDGTVGGTGVSDGEYLVEILGVGAMAEGVETDSLALLIDRIAPSVDVLTRRLPADDPVVANGDTIQVRACVSGDPATVVFDASAIDDAFDPGGVTEVPDDGCRIFTYVVSLTNPRVDGDNLPVRIVATDIAGNRTSRNIPLCLRNNPPTVASSTLLNTPVVVNGDVISARIQFNSPNTITVTAGFSSFDTGFNPANVIVTPLGNQEFRVDYTISSGNVASDGDYRLRLIGSDQGCGTVTDTSLTITLDNDGEVGSLVTGFMPLPAAISPNGDGVQDVPDFAFTVVEDPMTAGQDTVTVLLFASVEVPNGAGGTTFRLLTRTVGALGSGDYRIRWDLAAAATPDVPVDQDLTVSLRASSADQTRQRTVTTLLEIDNTPPALLAFPDPDEFPFENGQNTAWTMVFDREGYDVDIDLGGIDSGFNPANLTVVDGAQDGDYDATYSVSATNAIGDTSNVALPLTARDAAGNTTTTDLLRGCLNNQPPVHVGSTLLTDNVVRNNDEIRIRSTWSSEAGQDSVTLTADFSQVDDRFDPATRLTIIPQGDGVFDVLYTIAAGNSIESREGAQIFLTASDLDGEGCGSTTVIGATVDVDNEPPMERPVLNAPGLVKGGTVDVSGNAPEAVTVEIQRNGVVIDSLDVLAGGSAFGGTVPVLARENSLTAISIDRAGNRSAPSIPVVVFSAQGNVFLTPGRFGPGDAFFVALFQPARNVTVRIFNLEGVEIQQIDGGSGDIFDIFWDGFDNRGVLASSGPYIAVAEVVSTDGSREYLRQAFVFTRTPVEEEG